MEEERSTRICRADFRQDGIEKRPGMQSPPVRFSWPDGNKALRDFVAVPQSFITFPDNQNGACGGDFVRCNILAAFVRFSF